MVKGIAQNKSDLVPIQCECGEFKELAFGTEKANCDKCHRGMDITWEILNEEETKEGDKHYGEYEVSYYEPFGGATSFSEAEAYQDSLDTAFAISSAKSMFDGIYNNIWSDDEKSTSEKVSATETAMKEMVTRMQNPEDNKSLGQKIKNLIGLGKDSEEDVPQRESLLSIFKDVNGDLRWLAIYTNKFEDREKEIFSEAAHKDYETWLDENQRFPSLRIWHLPGTELGLADHITYADGFMLATGTFYEKSLDVAEKLAMMDDLGLSHGFIYKSEDLSDDGVYSHYRTFEISVLPMKHAANSWTAFTMESLQKEVAMGLDTKKRPFFVDLLGEERVATLEKTLPEITKDLGEAGVGWKDLEEALDISPNGDSGEGEGNGEGKGEEGKGDGEGDGAGEGEGAPAGAGIDEKALEDIKNVLEPLTSSIKEIGDRLTELEKTDDEKISGKMQQSQIDRGQRPSDSKENVLDNKEDTKNLDQPDGKQGGGASQDAARDIVNTLLLGKKQPVGS